MNCEVYIDCCGCRTGMNCEGCIDCCVCRAGVNCEGYTLIVVVAELG